MKLRAKEINKAKSQFSKMHDNMTVYFLKLIEVKEKVKINNNINEKGDITTQLIKK